MTIRQYMVSRFDLEALVECGFLDGGMTVEDAAERICTFFGLETIFEYDFIMEGYTCKVEACLGTFSIN